MLGYSAGEMLQTTWMASTHPDDLESSLSRVQQLLLTPDVLQGVEKRYVRSDGTAVWTRVRVSAVRDGSGNPVDLVVHVEDITERKLAEKALRESEERLRIMADGCPSVMWVSDEKGRLLFVNRECRKLPGVNYRGVEGDWWRLLFHPDDALEHGGVPAIY
jgi:PAS domain S-box-containing protein